MATMSVDAIRSALLQESLGRLGGAGGVKGLLTPTQTPLQAGLLGAMQQLQPFTGYTTTPTTFGQAIGAGLMGAAGGVQKQKESDIASALKGLELYSALDTDDDSEFDKQLKEYEKLSLIPQDQRTQQQQLRLDVLTDKLRDQPTKDSLSDFTLSVIKKAEEEGMDSLSDVEKDAYNRWKKGDGMGIFAQAFMDSTQKETTQEPGFFDKMISGLFSSDKKETGDKEVLQEESEKEIIKEETVGGEEQIADNETIDLVSQISQITLSQGQDAAVDFFRTLTPDQQKKVLGTM
jgi:hypothetical protein